MTIPDNSSPADGLSSVLRQTLLEVAGRAIDFGLTHCQPLSVVAEDYPPSLREMRAAFVTLHREDRLRGCIGSLTPHRSLVMDVA